MKYGENDLGLQSDTLRSHGRRPWGGGLTTPSGGHRRPTVFPPLWIHTLSHTLSFDFLCFDVFHVFGGTGRLFALRHVCSSGKHFFAILGAKSTEHEDFSPPFWCQNAEKQPPITRSKKEAEKVKKNHPKTPCHTLRGGL